MAKSARVVGEALLSRGRFDLTRTDIEVVEDDGGERALSHEVYRHGKAAAALLYDPARSVVTLVKQFRAGAFLSDGALATIEACAGMLDGDAPGTCVVREALEETGLKIASPRHAFDAYMSPGGMTEKIACFVAPYGEGRPRRPRRRRRRGRAYRGGRSPVRRGARDDRKRRHRRRQDHRAPLLRQGGGDFWPYLNSKRGLSPATY